MKAVIRVDAFSDRSYHGKVKSVAVLPDQGGWLASDTKVYKTIVTIDEEVTQLKPGMTAVVEIDIEQLKDVLSVPIQAIVQRGSENWCYVQHRRRRWNDEHSRWARRTTSLSRSSRVLEEADVVVLNPMSLVDEQRWRRRPSRRRRASRGRRSRPKRSRPKTQSTDGAVPAPDNATQSERGEATERGPRPTAPPTTGEREAKGGGRGDAGGGPPGKRPDRAGEGGFDMMQFDKNGDGQVTKEELPERMQPMFDGLDKNQDGVLEASEMVRPGRKDRPNQDEAQVMGNLRRQHQQRHDCWPGAIAVSVPLPDGLLAAVELGHR